MQRLFRAIHGQIPGKMASFVSSFRVTIPFAFRPISPYSDQVVTLTTVDPHIRVRIIGITSDYGFLRTMPEGPGHSSHRGEPFIDLQPDGNSFDIMAGLIKIKK